MKMPSAYAAAVREEVVRQLDTLSAETASEFAGEIAAQVVRHLTSSKYVGLLAGEIARQLNSTTTDDELDDLGDVAHLDKLADQIAAAITEEMTGQAEVTHGPPNEVPEREVDLASQQAIKT